MSDAGKPKSLLEPGDIRRLRDPEETPEPQDGEVQDYRLTTAEILYKMPDYPNLVQSYLWQSLDRVPDFPKLNEFLGFWEARLEGTLHSVRIGYVGIMQPTEWELHDDGFTEQ